MNSPEDTIAAIATPLGEGGIGVIRISGSRAIAITQTLFKPAKPLDLSHAPSHTCHYGTLIDNVLVTLFRNPNSYTGEDVVEISAHGNPFTLNTILQRCVDIGARLAGPGEFTERAFLNGKIDLTQAEAVADLIHAKTEKSQSAALAQLRGGLAKEVRSAREVLLPLLAHVEVGLDHADEDHDFISRDRLQADCARVQQSIESVLQSASVGKVLRNGFRVALVGRPNVGKSSLLNALLKEDRAIVTPVAGTTRDTLEETLSIHGVPVVLTDTAGLREHTQDPVERIGMQRTRSSVDAADAVIGLFDGAEDLTDEDRAVIREASRKPHVWVINKIDLPGRLSAACLQSQNGGGSVIELSTKTGAGLPALLETLTQLAFREKAAAAEAQWLLNNRHENALQRAHQALAQARAAAATDTYEECVALELKTALDALGEIIGETTTEDLLGQIFSQFCVGK